MYTRPSNHKSGTTTPNELIEDENCQCDDCLMYNPPTLSPTPQEPQNMTSYFMSKDEEVLVLEDVLPPFHMHNNLLNRTLTQVGTDTGAPSELPDYQTAINETLVNGLSNGHPVGLDNNTLQPQQSTHSSNQSTTSSGSLTNTALENTQPISNSNNVFSHDKENLILNNLDRLQKINSPLRIHINITTAYPQMSKPLQKANPLREFQPGDTVTGSIIVENNSTIPIPFEMFLVSLEGFTTVPNTSGSKLKRKTFMKMVDFGACYHDGYIPTTNVKTPYYAKRDKLDNSVYGFPETKIIEPGAKHKKFFYFKLPKRLLDQSCDHQLMEHFETLPPSFGLDQECFNFRGHQIVMNEYLGYGRLQDSGTPVLVNDQNERGQSISYAIICRMIGKKNEAYKKFYQNDTSHDYKFIMIKEVQSFIRLIPNEEVPLPDYSPDSEHTGQGVNTNKAVFKRPSTKIQLDRISNIATETINRLKQRKELINVGVKDDTELNDLTIDFIDYSNYNVNQSDDKKKPQLQLNTVIQPTLKAESKSISSKVLIPLKSKKKTFSFASNKLYDDMGILSFTAILNIDKKLEYNVPKVLKKISSDNNNSSSSELNQIPLSLPTSPIMSPLLNRSLSGLELNPIDSVTSLVSTTSELELGNVISSSMITESPYLNQLCVELKYIIPSSLKDSSSLKPPELLAVKPTLKSFTISSRYPIPIVFDYETFMSSFEKSNHTLNQIRQRFLNHLNELKRLSSETNKGIEKQLFYDLLSISNMKILEKTLPIFKDFNLKEQPKWDLIHDDENNQSYYKSNLKIDLFKDNHVIKNLAILPNFSTCFYHRFYFINLELSLKKFRTNGITLNLPVEVAKYSVDRHDE